MTAHDQETLVCSRATRLWFRVLWLVLFTVRVVYVPQKVVIWRNPVCDLAAVKHLEVHHSFPVSLLQACVSSFSDCDAWPDSWGALWNGVLFGSLSSNKKKGISLCGGRGLPLPRPCCLPWKTNQSLSSQHGNNIMMLKWSESVEALTRDISGFVTAGVKDFCTGCLCFSLQCNTICPPHFKNFTNNTSTCRSNLLFAKQLLVVSWCCRRKAFLLRSAGADSR